MSVDHANAEQTSFDAVTLDSGKDMAAIGYGLMLASVFFWPLCIATIILCFMKRGPFVGHWLYTHFVWQIRTIIISFVLSMFGMAVIGAGTIFHGFNGTFDRLETSADFSIAFFLPYIVGGLIIFLQFIWFIYRGIVGWMRLSDNKPAKKLN